MDSLIAILHFMAFLGVVVVCMIAFALFPWKKMKDLPVLRPKFIDDPMVDLPDVSYILKLTHIGDKPNAPLVRAVREHTGVSLQEMLRGAICTRNTGEVYTVLEEVSLITLRFFLDRIAIDYTLGEDIDFSLHVVSYNTAGERLVGDFASVTEWKEEIVDHV